MLWVLCVVVDFDLGLLIVVGNIVIVDGVVDFVDVGVMILKVGVGFGVMCMICMMIVVGWL